MSKVNWKKVGEYGFEIALAVVAAVYTKYTNDRDFEEKFDERYEERKLLERRESNEKATIREVR